MPWARCVARPARECRVGSEQALPLGRACVNVNWPIDRPPQWVARGRELATLRAAMEGLRHGGGTAVWVEGEPGIGKSSLVVEALARAGELG